MEDRKPLRVGLAGLGVVGAGVAELLVRNAALIAARAGRPIEVTAVTARHRGRDRGLDLTRPAWAESAIELAGKSEIDVFVELIGGSEGVAREAVEAALRRSVPVITANKALLAHHGAMLARMAETKGVTLAFEAAVAGGIPIIKALREGLAGNRLTRVYGILNGTSNYILSKMRQGGRDFADVLADAQKLGYAETDPDFDVDGIDAAHKLAILAAVAFGSEIAFDKVHIEGIRHISSLDIAFANELGYRIKLLGIATRTEAGLEQRVHPCMVPCDHAIALVEEVHNAVVIEGDSVGDAMLVGRGAGAGPTASAVVADLIDLARGVTVPTFAVPANNREPIAALSIDRHRGAYYVRLMVQDQPGVIADVASALRNENVSMEAMIQRGRNPGEIVPVVLTTHETEEAAMRRALSQIARLPAVLEAPRLIRIMEQVSA